MVMHNFVHMARVTGNYIPRRVYRGKRQIKMQRNFFTPKLPN